MNRFAITLLLCAGQAGADPLGLIDYEALFAENAADVEVVSPDRSILQIGEVTILRGSDLGFEFTGLDESGEGAVGCFVSVLASLEAAVQACGIVLTPEQEAARADYRSMALKFYSANALPPATIESVRDAYARLISDEVLGVLPFCDNADQFVTFANRLFAPEARPEIEGMMSIQRLPVTNPCL